MVNFNLSEEEKKRILSLHESHKQVHGTVMSEQVATNQQKPVATNQQKPATTQPAQSKYKLPEITDDTKFTTFVTVNGTEDMRPSGLYNAADNWWKTEVAPKRKAGTLTNQQIIEYTSSYTKWTNLIDTIAKQLLSMSAFQGYNAESFKTLDNSIITRQLDLQKVPKPYNDTWESIIGQYVGSMQSLKNGMSLLITQQLNRIK